MENASKALTFAGTILISLLVISAFVFMYRDLTSGKRQEAENEKVAEVTEFNKSFESYDKKLHGTELFSLANKVWDYNKKYDGKDGYKAITLKIKYDFEGSNEINQDTVKKMQDDVDAIISKYKNSSNLQALYDAKTSGSYNAKDKAKAKQTEEQILGEIGLKEIPKTIEDDYKVYNTYKTFKNTSFTMDEITYYNNGRIETMSYSKK